MKVYLAGPLFTVAERNFNIRLANLLEVSGIKVWLPQENEPRVLTAKSIFDTDVQGIHESDAVVAIMDGPDPDSGTSWEVGYAFARNKYILLVRTDFRGAGENGLAPYNIMLSESANHKISVLSFNASTETLARDIVNHLNSVVSFRGL